MILYKGNYQGATLLEMLLVTAIGVSLLVVGMRQYQTFKLDVDIQQLQSNVNVLFQAMARYYTAQCYGGALDPNYSPTPSNPFPISISALTTAGYLMENLPVSPLASTYVLQFNQSTTTRMQNLSPSGSMGMGTIVIWRAQVAVQLNNTANTAAYKNYLGADCVSSPLGSIVTPCASALGGTYLVWERLPSFASPNSQSDLWLSNPMLQQFNQMYTTYPMGYLLNTTPEGQTPSGQQYYLCGS